MSRFDRAHAPASHPELPRLTLQGVLPRLTSTLADAAALPPGARR